MRPIDRFSAPEHGPTGGWRALGSLLPYLWPKEAPSLRLRVVLAMAMLLAARVVSVYIPLFYAQAVDALSPDDIGLIAVPLGLILAYGGARILSLAFNEARDAIFVNVAERAIRTIALEVFHHLHALSLRFHLGRQTGRLSQALDRGGRAISLLLRFSLFSIVPTAINWEPTQPMYAGKMTSAERISADFPKRRRKKSEMVISRSLRSSRT